MGLGFQVLGFMIIPNIISSSVSLYIYIYFFGFLGGRWWCCEERF